MVNAPPPPTWSTPQPGAPPGAPAAMIGAPAGFWIRFVAYLVDAFVVWLAAVLVGGIIVGLAVVFSGGNIDEHDWPIYVAIVLIGLAYFVGAWLYEALLTSGPHGATLGKQAVGVRIVRADGAPMSFGRATGRHFLKAVVTPMVPLAIGYILAAFTSGKRALHDFMADTLVIKSR